MIALVAGVVFETIAPGELVAGPVPLLALTCFERIKALAECRLLLRAHSSGSFVQQHLWPVAVQLGFYFITPLPLETTRLDTDHFIVICHR